MGKRKEYNKEYKERAVEYLENSEGRTIKSVASDLGINAENLRRWKEEKEEGKQEGKTVFPGKGNARDEELMRLKKENMELREANEILKKAMAIFTESKRS